jgi:type II secretory pathway pseudopilin PulG
LSFPVTKIVYTHMKNLLKNQNKQSGFSLIEVMVAGGIMVAMGLALTNLTQNTTKAIKHSENRNEFELVFAKTAATMVEELNCYETLRPVIVDNASTPLPTITRCNTPERFMAQVSALGSNDPRDSNYVAGYECSLNPSDIAPTVPTYHATCRHEGRQLCRDGITSTVFTSNTPMVNDTFTPVFTFVITDALNTTANTGRGSLEVRFNKTAKSAKSSYGGDSLRKIDDIIFEFDPVTRRIRRCFTDFNGSINTAVARACTGNTARLEGDPNDPNNPLRCVHDADISATGPCPRDTFMNGYLSGTFPAPVPAGYGDNTLRPNCQPLQTKSSQCAPGQYLVESGTPGSSTISCHSVPTCGIGQHLVRGGDGFLACENFNTGCGPNSILVTRNDGSGLLDCRVCNQHEYLVKMPSGTWECKSPAMACNDSKTNGQEYMLGINADGTPMCRTLITQEKPCQYGAQLTIKPDGSIGTTCCPSCSAAESDQICLGQSFVSNNACGSVCMGTKNIRNGSPGPWYTVADCSPWQLKKLERRDCMYAECGGDNTCTGHEMQRETDCWLYNNQHTFVQCNSNGGSISTHGSFSLCYYSGYIQGGRMCGSPRHDGIGVIGSHGHVSCPAGWAALNNYSSSSWAGCGCSRSSADGCSLPECGTASVSGWWRSNTFNTSSGYDARRTGFWGCGTSNSSFTCYASMTERGCY